MAFRGRYMTKKNLKLTKKEREAIVFMRKMLLKCLVEGTWDEDAKEHSVRMIAFDSYADNIVAIDACNRLLK